MTHIEAEIKLKRALENMMSHLEMPALIIRSVSLKALSALKDFGIILPKDAEIDLVLAFVSGDVLHVVICSGDKEKLVTAKHEYNLESIDKKIVQKEFVMASPQQQQATFSFPASSIERHLVLEGPAGSGKTLVALQVAKNLIENAQESSKGDSNEPLLVFTALWEKQDSPLMKFLDTNFEEIKTPKIFKGWSKFGVQDLKKDGQLLQMAEALPNEWQERQIVVLVDEIDSRGMMASLADQVFPESVRMILVLNPVLSRSLTTLPFHYLCVTLTTPYRSTRAITSLAQFISKCHGRIVPEGDFGSDVEGMKPILFDVGNDERKMEEALGYCRKDLADKSTIIYDPKVPPQIKKKVEQYAKRTAGSWDCHEARSFFGW